LLGLVAQLSDEAGEEPSEDLLNFMKDLKRRQLLLSAPSNMIQAFNKWELETGAAQARSDQVAAVFAWEEMLRAIRRDLGHDDPDLPRGELLRVFLNDLDEHLIAGPS
jgi:hypothetical protein